MPCIRGNFREEKKMVFRKAATNSVAWAAMGFAFTGAVHAQVDVPAVSPPVVGTQDVTDPDIGDGAITRNGKLNADAATDRHATPGDATGSAGAKASDRSIDVNAGVQSDGDRLGVDAAACGATKRNDSGVNADANSGNKSQNQQITGPLIHSRFLILRIGPVMIWPEIPRTTRMGATVADRPVELRPAERIQRMVRLVAADRVTFTRCAAKVTDTRADDVTTDAAVDRD